jgi:hypothetical protein
MVLAPFVNYNMDAIFPFCAEAAHYKLAHGSDLTKNIQLVAGV